MEGIKFSNISIAKALSEVAAAYEVKGENRFKIRAYNTAADSVEHATSEVKDLWEEGKLDELPGIGESISSHLDEYFRTGRVKHFEEVKEDLPAGMFEIFGLEGVGPKRAFRLSEELGVKSVEGLYKAAQEGKIADLEGFGEKSQEQIVKAIERKSREQMRTPLPIAFSLAERLLEKILKFPRVSRADPLGSLRRMVATVGDVDIGVATTKPEETIERFVKLPEVGRVLAAGGAKASVLLKTGQQVDVRAHDPESYGALLQYFTGSKQHNIHLRKIANAKGYTLSEYGIAKFAKGKKVGEPLPVDSEEEFYRLLGMPWIAPELREDQGEIEAAQRQAQGKPDRLPELVELKDIKGEVHVHTDNSPDGEIPAEELVKRAVGLGYEFIGIADHSPSVHTRGREGARREILKRKKEVERLRKKFKRRIEIFFGAETNIDATGKMALPNELLKLHEFIVASIHTSFDQPRSEITQRLVSALRNPYVNMIGHPTGRLLTMREAYEADWDRVFKITKEEGKIMEINAYPLRLDLPDRIVKTAKDMGIPIVISTDAHRVEHLENLRFGVSVARRGWCEKKDILTTRGASEFAKLFRIRR
ncbi:DNA polymerase/3'-5' exonuclease PolX [Candidatus Saccharibacteria bacterium]|nr:DNA polymerase/3'-5' exonuclease PolX [Candidatus Saccharibacteria bacterium]